MTLQVEVEVERGCTFCAGEKLSFSLSLSLSPIPINEPLVSSSLENVTAFESESILATSVASLSLQSEASLSVAQLSTTNAANGSEAQNKSKEKNAESFDWRNYIAPVIQIAKSQDTVLTELNSFLEDSDESKQEYLANGNGNGSENGNGNWNGNGKEEELNEHQLASSSTPSPEPVPLNSTRNLPPEFHAIFAHNYSLPDTLAIMPQRSSASASLGQSAIGLNSLLMDSQTNGSHLFHRSHSLGPSEPIYLKLVYAQIFGECEYDPKMIKGKAMDRLRNFVTYGPGAVGGGGSLFPNISENRPSAKGTKMHSVTILSIPPVILASNILIKSIDPRIIKFDFVIPRTLPPSYVGKSLSFMYRLKIGLETKSETMKHFDIPLRIFPYYQENGQPHSYDAIQPVVLYKDFSRVIDMSNPQSADVCDVLLSKLHNATKGHELTVVAIRQEYNKFEREHRNRLPFYEEYGQSFTRATSRILTGHYVYDISKNDVKIGQFITSKNVWQLGESIIGRLVLFQSDSNCSKHVAISLECSEIPTDTFAELSKSKFVLKSRKIYQKQQFDTLFTSQFQISLYIPQHLTPTFESAIINYSWFVKFEFLLCGKREAIVEELSEEGKDEDFVKKIRYNCASNAMESFECLIPVTIVLNEAPNLSKKFNKFHNN